LKGLWAGYSPLVSKTELWAVMDQTIGDAGGHFNGVAFARYVLAAWP